jgi:hypothetical protein
VGIHFYSFGGQYRLMFSHQWSMGKSSPETMGKAHKLWIDCGSMWERPLEKGKTKHPIQWDTSQPQTAGTRVYKGKGSSKHHKPKNWPFININGSAKQNRKPQSTYFLAESLSSLRHWHQSFKWDPGRGLYTSFF